MQRTEVVANGEDRSSIAGDRNVQEACRKGGCRGVPNQQLEHELIDIPGGVYRDYWRVPDPASKGIRIRGKKKDREEKDGRELSPIHCDGRKIGRR